MDRKSLLVEQYKIMEERRNFFGKLFWQVPSFFIAVFAILVSIVDKDSPRQFKVISLLGGAIFLLISWMAHRLRVSQDECERVLAEIERKFDEEKIENIVSLPLSRKYGARTAIIIALIVSGISLLIAGFRTLVS